MPLIRSHSTQHGADGCVAIVSSPVTSSPPPPMSVFLTRTVSSPLLDRRCPLTTVVKGRAAQTEHRHREGTHSHQWRVTRFRQTQPTPLLVDCVPVAQNGHRQTREQLSSAQHSTAHSAHSLSTLDTLRTGPRTHFRPPATADTSEPARRVHHQSESEMSHHWSLDR